MLKCCLVEYCVVVPSREPSVNRTLISAYARFISFDLEPPPVESWNGILGGYVLSYRNHELDQTLKRTVDDPKQEVCVICLLSPHMVEGDITQC